MRRMTLVREDSDTVFVLSGDEEPVFDNRKGWDLSQESLARFQGQISLALATLLTGAILEHGEWSVILCSKVQTEA